MRMSFLTCKACGAEAVTPLEMDVEGGEGLLSEAEEAHFYTCQVCGDNWLSVRRLPVGGGAELTFVHQMGMQPLLRRTAQMTNAIVMTEASVNTWSYYLGDDEVAEDEWRSALVDRRKVLKSVCTN